MNSYDLSIAEELVEFDRDCANAARECPQCNEISMLYEPLSIANVFTRWFEEDLLWDKEYYCYLTDKAFKTFSRYAVFRNGDIFDLNTKRKFSHKDIVQINRVHTFS